MIRLIRPDTPNYARWVNILTTTVFAPHKNNVEVASRERATIIVCYLNRLALGHGVDMSSLTKKRAVIHCDCRHSARSRYAKVQTNLSNVQRGSLRA